MDPRSALVFYINRVTTESHVEKETVLPAREKKNKQERYSGQVRSEHSQSASEVNLLWQTDL